MSVIVISLVLAKSDTVVRTRNWLVIVNQSEVIGNVCKP